VADVYKGLTIRIGADTHELSQKLRDAKKQMSGLPTEIRKIEKALKIDPGNTAMLAQQQEAYRKAIRASEQQLESLRAAERQVGQSGMSDEQWKRLQADIAMCEQRLDGYRQALADSIVQQTAMESALGRAGAKLEDWGGKLEAQGRRVERIGSALTRTVTPAIGAVAVASVAAATEIDDSLTSVRKTVDGTEADYARLKEAAISFSRTNAVSASQILDIQALGAQLGYAIDELQLFGEVVSGLDIATNMSAEDAATELAQFANIMGMAHDKTKNYGSTIVALGNSFATTEADISHMAMRIAGAGKSIGLTEADVLGLATALSSMGIEAEAGGTAISTVMSSIDKAVALNSESVADWAAAANMSAAEFSAAWKSNAVGTLSQVLVGMDGATQAGGNLSAMLDELGITSIRQTDTLKRLANNSEFLGRAVGTANQAWRENTALDAEVANRNESISAKFEMLKNRVIEVAARVGGPLAAALLDIVDCAEPLITAIAEGARSFEEMSNGEQQAVLRAVALSAAMGPMLTVFGKGLQAVKPFGTAMVELSKSLAAAKVANAGAAASASAAGTAHAAAVPGVKAFNAAMRANPIGLAVTALTVLVPLVMSAGTAFAALGEQSSALTVKSQEQSDRVDELRARYDELCETQGAGSDAALKAKAAYEEEAAAFEESRKSLKQLTDQCNDTASAHASMVESLDSAKDEADSQAGAILSLADSVASLMEAEGDESRAKGQLQAQVEALNTALGYEAVTYDEVTGAVSATAEEVKALAKTEADRVRSTAAVDRYNKLLEDSVSVDADLAEAQENLEAASKGWGIWIGDFPVIADDASVAYHDLEKAAAELEAAQADNNERTEEALAVIEENAARNQALAQAVDEVKSGNLDAAAAAELYGQALEGGLDETEVAVQAAQELSEAEEELSKKVQKIADDLGEFAAAQPHFASAISDAGWTVEELAEHLNATGQEASDLTKAFEDLSGKTCNAFDEIEQKQDVSLDKMLETLEHNRKATANWSDNLAALYESAASESERRFLDYLGGMGPEYAGVLEQLRSDTTGMLARLAAEYDAGGQAAGDALIVRMQLARDGAASAAQGAADAVAVAMQSMAEAAGESADDVAAKLAEAGVSTEQLAELTDEQLAEVCKDYDGTVGSIAAKLDKMGVDCRTKAATAGRNVASGLSSGQPSVSSAAAALKATAANQMAALSAAATLSGAAGGAAYATAVKSKEGATRTSANALSAAAKSGLTRYESSLPLWGQHVGENFAGGIRNQRSKSAVESALDGLASLVKKFLGHTVAEAGPLHEGGEGEVRWGRHAVENYIAGMQQAIPGLRKVSEEVAAVQQSALGGAAGIGPLPSAATIQSESVHRVISTVTVERDAAAGAELKELVAEVASLRREIPRIVADNAQRVVELDGRVVGRTLRESEAMR